MDQGAKGTYLLIIEELGLILQDFAGSDWRYDGVS